MQSTCVEFKIFLFMETLQETELSLCPLSRQNIKTSAVQMHTAVEVYSGRCSLGERILKIYEKRNRTFLCFKRDKNYT